VLYGYRWNFVLTNDMGEIDNMICSEQYVYSRFPESLFSCIEDTIEYNKRIAKGVEIAAKSNVVITGLCRDIINVLDHTVARLYKTASLFNDCKFVIYENDSVDGTAEKLREYADKDRDIILIQEKEGHKYFEQSRELARPKYLAGLRNICQDTIRDINKLFPVDYIIVIDLDLEGGWSYDGLLDSFSHSGWSAMTANGIEFKEIHIHDQQSGDTAVQLYRCFYDTWAYKEYDNENVLDSTTVNKYRFERGEKPIDVFSNFNGLGIYRYEDAIDCTFDAEERPDGSVINEWSYYHREMRDRGCSIYLNPSMITLYTPHEFSHRV